MPPNFAAEPAGACHCSHPEFLVSQDFGESAVVKRVWHIGPSLWRARKFSVFFISVFFISGPQLLCLEQVYSALKPSSNREPGPPESPGSEHSQVTGNPGTWLLDELPFGYLT